MRNEIIRDATALQAWFNERLLPLFEQLKLSERAAALKPRIERAAALAHACEETPACCFLGSSGVGKSTLINALVAGDRAILPNGGIGPLTAQATVVRSADAPALRAEYFGATELNQVLFSLERQIDQTSVPPAGAGSESDDGESRREALHKQALLLVTGRQYQSGAEGPTLRYLAEAIRTAMGTPTKWNETLRLDDAARVDRVRRCVEIERQKGCYEVSVRTANREFHQDVLDHAAGYLAPLIRSLDVSWPSPQLSRGVTLVDLPGIGIANDVYREVTNKWVRERARAIVLVVDRAGVTEAAAQLRRGDSGVLARLYHTSDAPDTDPLGLVVVVTKADEPTSTEWQRDRDVNGREQARSWVAHLEVFREQAGLLIRGQLAEQLRTLLAEDSGEQSEVRRRIIERLLDRVEVHVVSATQHRLLLLAEDDDEAERPKIKTVEQSGVPSLVQSLERIATGRRHALEQRARTALDEVRDAIRAEIDAARTLWLVDRREQKEVEHLREALDTFLGEVRGTLDRRQGAYREYLRKTAPLTVENEVRKATTQGELQIRDYLQKVEVDRWHHGTLRAAVRRGGTYAGRRKVAFPTDFTERLEEQIALVWSNHVLAGLRQETQTYQRIYIANAERVAGWARNTGAQARPEEVERLQRQIAGDAQNLLSVGDVAVDDLRQKILFALRQSITAAIEKHCEEFIQQGRLVGWGMKDRILKLLHHTLVPGAVAAARDCASQLLK
ncbi:MAG: dynamin family protein, partial [Planctomycetaceae bacterium]